MTYKAKVALCSEIRTKHSMQSEHHVEFLSVKPGGTKKKPLGFKRLRLSNGTNVVISHSFPEELHRYRCRTVL
jgi:hypothetical protein